MTEFRYRDGSCTNPECGRHDVVVCDDCGRCGYCQHYRCEIIIARLKERLKQLEDGRAQLLPVFERIRSLAEFAHQQLTERT